MIDCEQSRRVVKKYKQGKLPDRKKAKVEVHVSQCPDCREYFREYQTDNGKGMKEWLAEKEPKFWGMVFLGCLILAGAAYTFGGFHKAADWWNSIRMPTEDSLAEIAQYGIGNEVYVSQQDKDVEVTITHVISDDLQTFVYYEVEDHAEGRLLRLDYSDPPRISSDRGVFNMERSYGQLVNGFKDDPQQPEGKYRGRIALPPIKEDNGAFDLKISRLMEVSPEDLEESNDPYRGAPSTGAFQNGKWEFTIEADKEEMIEKPIDVETEIEGIQIVVDQVRLAPTGTVIEYRYERGPAGSDTFFYFDHLSDGETSYHREDFGMANGVEQNQESAWVHERAVFESMYRTSADSLELGISRLEQYIPVNESFPIDPEKSGPQSFTFKGIDITVEDIQVDQDTSLTIKEDWNKDRPFERLEYEVLSEPKSMTIGQQEKNGILVDEEGNRYEEGDVQSWEQMQKLRYFPLEHTFILDSSGSEEVKPIGVRIIRYQKTDFPTETISFDL
ncbi:DUF4179 domain-containing protein [Virgibacillus senegalensis]|uniref:DUF4179 domain-containing protein n=1 Tax=Virgibacillus senegalensis TaxID=1499679 RepID=UPI000B1B28D8|nr:DUF4179 domain-containing protein [Virgibacillus senegalensis]